MLQPLTGLPIPYKPARDPSLRSELALERSEGMTASGFVILRCAQDLRPADLTHVVLRTSVPSPLEVTNNPEHYTIKIFLGEQEEHGIELEANERS